MNKKIKFNFKFINNIIILLENINNNQIRLNNYKIIIYKMKQQINKIKKKNILKIYK